MAMLAMDRGLVRAGERVCVAVSGGADSVALLVGMVEANTASKMNREALGVVLRAAHVHHGLRGAEADGDEAFVRELCGRLGVELTVFRVDTAERQRVEGEGVEEAARELRYEALRGLMTSGAVDVVATAHTLDDQAETVVMKMLRGAWTEGLGGISPEIQGLGSYAGGGSLVGKRLGTEGGQRVSGSFGYATRDEAASGFAQDDNSMEGEKQGLRFAQDDSSMEGEKQGLRFTQDDSSVGGEKQVLRYAKNDNSVGASAAGRIVRPLLGVRRAEVEAFLRERGQGWREDATNADVSLTRNRVRHVLMPMLREFNPGVDGLLARMAEVAREEEAYWQAEVERVLAQVLLPGKPVRGGGRAVSTAVGEVGYAMEIERLRAMPGALRRRVVRAAARKVCGEGYVLGGEETAKVLALAGFGSVGVAVTGRIGSRLELHGGLRVERSPREIRLWRQG